MRVTVIAIGMTVPMIVGWFLLVVEVTVKLVLLKFIFQEVPYLFVFEWKKTVAVKYFRWRLIEIYFLI